jgi:hypothetical protein
MRAVLLAVAGVVLGVAFLLVYLLIVKPLQPV